MPINYQRILVPVDFSPGSLGALHHAAEIARKINGEIYALHVLETYDHNVDLGDIEHNTKTLEERIELKLDDFRAEHSDLWGVRLKTLLSKGKAHREIIARADEIKADLIVMGTHGHSGIMQFEKYMLGSNAYRVVHGANCPVLTVRNTEREIQFKNIILPLDLSKTTDQKVNLAIATAKYFDSKIHVISVYEFLGDIAGNVEELSRKLDAVSDKVIDAGIECEIASVENRQIAKSVLKYAKEVNGDLIIIMTRQEKRWDEYVMGNAARRIIERSEIPVLSTHPKKS